jgi:hypothetical protein
VIVSFLLFAHFGPASATPMDPALQQELLDLYGRYGKLVVAGKLADAARLRSAKYRAEMLTLAKKPKREQAETLEMVRLMTPDRVAPLHANLTAAGSIATIVAIASKTWPAGVKLPHAPKPGTVTHGEVTLEFAREGRTWKLQDQIFGPDPATIKSCHDEAAETADAYDRNRNTNIGGQIRQVDFKADHTLVAIRIVDEEDCLILPPRERLAQKSVKLVPWALIEADGAPHRTDKQRFWVDDWTVTDEE